MNDVCCFGRDLQFLQVGGQIHEIDNESIANAYLQETIEPQDGLEFVKCASVEAWKDLPHFLRSTTLQMPNVCISKRYKNHGKSGFQAVLLVVVVHSGSNDDRYHHSVRKLSLVQ